MKVLVTGANGFIGKNLCIALKHKENVILYEYDVDKNDDVLFDVLRKVDIVYHLAGINRPKVDNEFYQGNSEFTRTICDFLIQNSLNPKIVFTSSIQAEQDNHYGKSKLLAEEILEEYSKLNGATVVIYRLKNLFGKWSKPNYNSVIATFCHNIANNYEISISDENKVIDLTYIDDVVDAFRNELKKEYKNYFNIARPLKSVEIKLGDLANLIKSFNRNNNNLFIPNFSNRFIQELYATYLSYVPKDDLVYQLDTKTDERGKLAEFIKSDFIGQLFVSHTKPGVIRGNHFHNTKTEKFFVVQGKALIQIRNINNDNIKEFYIDSEEYKVVDIPPGCTHSIENIGDTELVTLFWASEIFDSNNPDTYYQNVVIK